MRTAIYTRISEDDGQALGVARQEADAREEADSRGWEVVDVYVDNDVSATRSKVRPEFQRMLRDVRSGVIQAVLIWDTDRLTRTPREAEDLIDLADSHKLQIVSLGSYRDLSTPNGRRDFRNDVTNARFETEKMARRLKRKFAANAEEGKPHGRAPYGMMRLESKDERGKTLSFWDVPDPETAPIVRELAERALAGDSLRGIAMSLTARGVPGPGSPTWNSTVIRQVLLRPSMAGLRQHRGNVVGKSNGGAVFEPEIRDRLVALLTDPSRKQNHRGREPLYLLSGIAKCGRCGGAMRSAVGHIATTVKGGTKRQPPSYNCTTCFKVRRQREPVDVLVESVVLARLDDPRIIERLYVKGDPEAAREALGKIDAINAKLALATDQYADDKITSEQFTRLTARLRDQHSVEEARLKASSPTDRLQRFSIGDIRETWAAAPIAARREVIDALFTVTIDPQGPGKPFDPDAIRIDWKSEAA